MYNRRTKKSDLSSYAKTAYTVMLLGIFFFSSCSNWKNIRVSHAPTTPYAYQGDTVDQWSLVRPDDKDELWGYVAADGNSAISSIFNWADDFNDQMALVRYDAHYTYVNRKGKQMRRIKAPHAYAFSEGLAAVQKDDKWGYIDRRGKWVIKPQFDWAFPFSQQLAAVSQGHDIGFINKKGEMVIPPQYEDAKPFVDNLSIVQKNGRYGMIDTLGREVLPAQFRRIEPWVKGTYKLHAADKKMGLAKADGTVVLDTLYTSIKGQGDNFLRVIHNRLVGLFDFNGTEILSPTYYFLGVMSDEGFLAAMKDAKFGIVDTAGKTLLPFIYEDGQYGFSAGRIVVHERTDEGLQGVKIRLMDTAFRVIKDLPYSNAYTFSNGFAIVEQQDEKDRYKKQYGYINRQGEEVIPPQYDSAYGFNRHGLTIVGTREKGITTRFVIDTTGTRRPLYILIDHLGNRKQVFQELSGGRPRELHQLKPFGDRLFYNKSGSNYTFLSPETGLILDTTAFPYQSLYPLPYSHRDDLATVRIDSLKGLIDTALRELLPVQFQDISTYACGYTAVKQNGKWGFADEQFKIRIPFIYDKVSSFGYGYATVEQQKQKGIIGPKGRVIIPLQYKNTTVDSTGNRIYAVKEKGTDIYDLYRRLLLSSDYDYISGYWGKSYTTFRQGDKMGALDRQFRVICEPQYDRIGPLYEGRAWVINGTKGGFVDDKFQLVIPIEYDYIEEYALGFTRVEKDDESFYIDIHGNSIQPSEQEIEDRNDVIEQRKGGFIDFSS